MTQERLIDKVTRSLLKRLLRGAPPSEWADLFAKGYWRSALRHGVSDPRTLQMWMEHSVARWKGGDSEAAEAELAELIARFGDVPPPGDQVVRDARLWRGRILSDLGRLDEAERVYRELAQEADRVLGSGDRTSLDAHENHAVVLNKLGRMEQGVAELAEVVALRDATSGTDAKDTLRARRAHAETLSQLGRLEESEKAWREAAAVYERQHRHADPDALSAQQKHAIALYKLGRMPEARDEFVRLADRLAATRGPGHPDTVRVWAWRDDAIRESATDA